MYYDEYEDKKNDEPFLHFYLKRIILAIEKGEKKFDLGINQDKLKYI